MRRFFVRESAGKLRGGPADGDIIFLQRNKVNLYDDLGQG
jgi:hypothetical protein